MRYFNRMKKLLSGLRTFAGFVTDFAARIFIGVFYFVVFFPVGLTIRLFSDLLRVKSLQSPGWIQRKRIADAGKFLRQQ